ncbi:hypothetical protein Tsubulata_019858 [Turnera subulata]|uniref:U3 small nucleolar ribonucleoprotein protein MPP10 n=1 Tax=Turnera subulata TaxID=218843 RepID=A0A9Q0JQQ8_9ROSI|nr:hypothetical protein Tsubulata_019858 [Turnera subulata]
MTSAEAIEPGKEALSRLKSTEATAWMSRSDSLSKTAREASQYLFSLLNPHAPKSPFNQLLVEGFDAEQIWQQIDLQSQPLVSGLRRKVRNFERNPEEIGVLKKVTEEAGKSGDLKEKEARLGSGDEDEDEDEDEMDVDGFDDDDDEEEEEEEEEEGVSGDEGKETKGGGIEDGFLKIKDLENYLEQDEAREYGLDDGNKKNAKEKKRNDLDEDEDEDDEEEDEEEEEDEDEDDEDDEFGDIDGDGEVEADKLARYEDFFGGKKKTVPTRKAKLFNESKEDSGSEDEQDGQERVGLSTHEKQLQKLQSEIEQMERANLEPKSWTMRGEVTAASRPKDSALEEVLDYDANARPVPVITEEVTASLEDIIKNRIIEGRFDDVEKAPSLPSKAPRELKELDENKSKKGLAEVYEDEYVRTTNPDAAPLSFSDEQKKEASVLFKRLCLKLDALSHFHFAPKPVIEEMSIQANVPALAMEEIAPVAVTDADMLAPEEVFSGKGDFKEEAELTQAERKRRRANKKRKFKAEAAKRTVKKPRDDSLPSNNEGCDQNFAYWQIAILVSIFWGLSSSDFDMDCSSASS